MKFNNIFSGRRISLLAALMLCVSGALAQNNSISSTTVEDYGDWKLECTVDGNNCRLYQRTAYTDTDRQISLTSISAKEDDYNMTFSLPLGVKINAPVDFKLNDRRAKKLKIDYCLNTGCFAAVELNGRLIKKIKKADEGGAIEMTTWNGKPFTVPFSTNGFAEGMEALANK